MIYVWSSHFPETITTNMHIGNDFFVLHTRLRVNKNFKIRIHYIEININVCLLCSHHVMTSIILHTRRPVNKNSVTHLVFMIQLISFFRILRSWKACFSHRSTFCPTSYVLMRLRCLEVSNRVRNRKILNFFVCLEVRILCKKVKYVWNSHFPEAITTNM